MSGMCVFTPAWYSKEILNEGSTAVLVSANEINAEQEMYVAEDKKMKNILVALKVIRITSVGRIHCCCLHAQQ